MTLSELKALPDVTVGPKFPVLEPPRHNSHIVLWRMFDLLLRQDVGLDPLLTRHKGEVMKFFARENTDNEGHFFLIKM